MQIYFICYFQNFNHDFVIIRDVDPFKYFTVFSTTELSHDLIIILITKGEKRESIIESICRSPPFNHV